MDIDDVYRQYFQGVYRFVLSLCHDPSVAEEVTEETFFKVLQHLDRFDGRCSMYAWLCQIAKNTYFSYRKKEKRRAAEEMSLFSVGSSESPEETIARKETTMRIHEAIHRLEAPYKEVFLLRAFGELPFAEIAALFGKTESWARVNYHRARLKIKEETE